MRVTEPAGFKGFDASTAITCTPAVDSLVRPALLIPKTFWTFGREYSRLRM